MKRSPDAGREALIRDRALALGFDAIGFADPSRISAAGERLVSFVERGWHGDMGWLADTVDRRRSPQAMWPAARSAIMVALNYGPDADPRATLEAGESATISVYARNRDYHDVVKGRLKQLAGWVHGKFDTDVKVFVDTAPLLEKPLAQAAGIGWQGKHTNLVSRDAGSWLFLGAILTALEFEFDEADVDHCGACQACLDVCPTKAFVAPYQLDARLCISYLTIEHKGHIPRDLRSLMGNRIYGCDDCLAVCPWNKFARPTAEEKLRAREDLRAPLLAELVALDDSAFRKHFAGSPIKRIGRDRFVRNVLIAIGNSGSAELSDRARDALSDPSPLVRLAAVWAVSRLMPRDEFQALRSKHETAESDPEVLAEWRAD